MIFSLEKGRLNRQTINCLQIFKDTTVWLSWETCKQSLVFIYRDFWMLEGLRRRQLTPAGFNVRVRH